MLERLIEMNLDSLASSGLDEKTYFMVRLAALVAMDAAPVSYVMNLRLASEAEDDPRGGARGAHRHLAGGRQRQGRLGRGQDAAQVRPGDRGGRLRWRSKPDRRGGRDAIRPRKGVLSC